MDLLHDLNPSQREAVTHPGGPLLVVAGAGTGKTKVITRRIAWQVAQGVEPSSVLALTFTNKAAGEMSERVHQLVGRPGVWLSTFHSLGARLLSLHPERLGYSQAFTIYDQSDKHSVIRELLKEMDFDTAQHPPHAVGDRISRAKDALLTPERFAEEAGEADPTLAIAARVYGAYQKRLLAQNAMDFDDLLMNLHRLWTEHPDLLEHYRARFTQVLVDEYQDTNRVQYLLVKMLAEKHRNLCATGDPDQSIYSWRGADLRNILDFTRDFPEAVTVRLEQNYRSTGTILAAASAMIRRNRQRIDRGLWTENPQGGRIQVWACADERDEADRIACEAIRLKEAGNRWSSTAVLYRQNAHSRALEQAMLRLKVPYQLVGTTAFYERREIKDALAYAVLALNPRADVALQRVVNVPPRGLGKTSLGRLADEASRAGTSLFEVLRRAGAVEGIPRRAAEACAGLVALLDEFRALPPSPVAQVVKRILERTGYLKHLGTLEPSEARERTANVLELVSAAAEYDAEHPDDGSLQGFLEGVALLSDADTRKDGDDAVLLMTLHSAKGLEFPHVFLAGVEDGLLPHAMSRSSEADLEEERRLLYVGLTRAMKRATLTWAQSRVVYGQWQPGRPSPFLDELPEQTLEGHPAKVPAYDPPPRAPAYRARPRWKQDPETPVFDPPPKDFDDSVTRDLTGLAKGDRVRHPSFGEGRIEGLSGAGTNARVQIRFRSGGVKTLVLGFANLERIAE